LKIRINVGLQKKKKKSFLTIPSSNFIIKNEEEHIELIKLEKTPCTYTGAKYTMVEIMFPVIRQKRILLICQLVIDKNKQQHESPF